MIRRAVVAVPLIATREASWAVLTDVEHSAAWLPGVNSSRVLTSEGDISVIEVDACGRRVILEVVHSPPNGARFAQVDQSSGGGVSGSWSLRDAAAGGLVLEVEIRVSSPLFAFGVGRRLRSGLEEAAAAIEERVKRPPTAQLATYRRALAIVRRGDVIEAHIGGEIVELCHIGGGE